MFHYKRPDINVQAFSNNLNTRTYRNHPIKVHILKDLGLLVHSIVFKILIGQKLNELWTNEIFSIFWVNFVT